MKNYANILLLTFFLCPASAIAEDTTEGSQSLASSNPNFVVAPPIVIDIDDEENNNETADSQSKPNIVADTTTEYVHIDTHTDEDNSDTVWKVGVGLTASGLTVMIAGGILLWLEGTSVIKVNETRAGGLSLCIMGSLITFPGIGLLISASLDSKTQSNAHNNNTIQWSPNLVVTKDYQGIGVNIVF